MTKEAILLAVAKEYDVTEVDIMSHCRTQPLAEARQMAMYILHRELHMSKSGTGRIFGRSHSSVCYDVARIGDLLTVDKSVRGRYERIMNELRKEA